MALFLPLCTPVVFLCHQEEASQCLDFPMWKRVIVKNASTITVPSAVQHMEVVNCSVKAQAFLVFEQKELTKEGGMALAVWPHHLDHTGGSTHTLAPKFQSGNDRSNSP